MACSSQPGLAVTGERLRWEIDEHLAPGAALERMRETTAGAALQEVTLRLFRAAWEQAYAARMDVTLAHRPQRSRVESRVSDGEAVPSEAQIDRAHEMLVDHWREQLEVAVLDRYRRQSRIDAVEWERIEADVQVVHGHLTPDEISDLLAADEIGERIVSQCVEQGYEGVQLYEQVVARLPEAQRRERLGEVTRPIRAIIFGPSEATGGVVSRPYLYQAENAAGHEQHGSVLARSAADAKQQLRNMGLQNPALLSEPTPGEPQGLDQVLDPEQARIAAQATRQGILRGLYNALVGNLWIWGPPAALLAWTVWEGFPLGWGDYVIIAYAALAAAAMLLLVLPMVLYDQLLRARAMGRWGAAGVWLWLLEHIPLVAAIPKSHLVNERAKILASRGHEAEALALWERWGQGIPEAEYQQGLLQIHDSAGNHEAAIAAQRALLAVSDGNETAAIDLAMSLARQGTEVDEAETLLGDIQPGDLSEVAMAGYQYARGLVAARRGQHEQALNHYRHAAEQAGQFRSNALMLTLIAEINGYAAVSMRRIGQIGQASALWSEVLPVLRVHRSCDRLVAEYGAD